MFYNQGNLEYMVEERTVLIPITDLEEGTNITKDFIVYKDEELLKIFSRKCDHAGGKLCKIKEVIACPLHGWEFNPESGAYKNVQVVKKEEDFHVEGDNIIVLLKKEIPQLPFENKNLNVSVELISHACILFKSDDFSFATDPWVEGFAFSSGWWPSQFPPILWEEKLNDVDFIYISHNHPDHLNQFTLEKIRKDMHFIVPAFENNSVKKLLNRFGFNNITSCELGSCYRFKNTSLYFSILKSGDFRDDSGFYLTYGNFSCLSSVDSNDLNFSKLPENITMYCSSFAGGASGFPLCFENIEEKRKPQIIERNRNAVRVNVKNQIKLCKSKFYLPYAGFFSERAERDAYIKKFNIKYSPSDYINFLDSLKVSVLDTSTEDSFLFNGEKLEERKKIERHDDFSEDPIISYSKVFADCSLSDRYIENFFKNSNFKDDLKVYFELTNDDFSKTSKYITIDFSKKTIVSFKKFNWKSIKDLYVENSRIRHLHMKVRKDSFLWVIKNNMPFEDLSIGFQCRIDRRPDIYNVSFWDHFTNVYI